MLSNQFVFPFTNISSSPFRSKSNKDDKIGAKFAILKISTFSRDLQEKRYISIVILLFYIFHIKNDVFDP